MLTLWKSNITYCKDPKFSDKIIWANSAHLDQTAPRAAKVKNKGVDWLCTKTKAILLHKLQNIQYFLHLNPKFQASSQLL